MFEVRQRVAKMADGVDGIDLYADVDEFNPVIGPI